MQVAPLTTSTAAAPSGAAEATDSRAEQFARMLQNAFFGSGSKAVARSAEPTAPEPAQRSDMRSHELRSNEVRTTERSETRSSDHRDAARPSAVEKKPAEQTSHTIAADKTAERSAAPRTPAEQTDSAEAPQSEDAAADSATPVAAPADETAAPVAESADEAAVTDAAAPDAVATTAAADLLLILSLLQNGQATAEAGQTIAANDQAAQTAVPATDSPVPVAGAAGMPAPPAVPASAVPAVPAQPALPTAEAAVPVPPVPVLPVTAEAPAILPETAAAMAKTTETAAAALLAQQQAITPEEFAAIQQALAMQGQAKQAAAPVKTDAKSGDGKGLTVDIQPALSNAASKTLVDQSALLAMQGDETMTQEAALPQAQPQAVLQPQSVAADAKFAAVLQAQAEPAVPQTNAAASLPNAPAHLNQQASPLANPGTPATQAAQQAASHIAARQLGAYIPAGEQVAVQIKRGVGEGLDKISIRLDPGSLGKVDVKMEVGHDGRLMAVISADKPETLAMLQRDAQGLEQSLRDAGLKTSSDSLSFTLRDQNQTADGRDGRDGQAGGGRHRGRGHDEYTETGTAAERAAAAAATAQRAASARGGLDIRI